jgi:hypothetical protein
LKAAVPAKRSFLRDLAWTPELFSLLPLTVAWGVYESQNSHFRASQIRGWPIREFWPDDEYTAGPGDTAVRQHNRSWDWTATYVKIASGDFDGDGVEDIMLCTSGSSDKEEDPLAAQWSYLYLLTRATPEPGAKLTLVRRLY